MRRREEETVGEERGLSASASAVILHGSSVTSIVS